MKSKIDLYVINKAKEKRLAKNWSQLEFANELEVSSGFIGQAESPKYPTKYNLQHINRMAKVFNCSLHEFLPKKPI
ncbi:MAG TPA: helix-turn-helix transcriptional regulator [Chlamydiales bacterium]|jgi:transcriptional regulator with XRE-family HTH domain|nr:helix-turn-helix transcriptional regulator [Chlamydiales bacterium]